jgi:hypothetical protein
MKSEPSFTIGLILAFILNTLLQVVVSSCQDAFMGYPVDLRVSTLVSHTMRSAFVIAILFSGLRWLAIRNKLISFIIGTCVAALIFITYVFAFALIRKLDFEPGTLFMLIGIRVGLTSMIAITLAELVAGKVEVKKRVGS